MTGEIVVFMIRQYYDDCYKLSSSFTLHIESFEYLASKYQEYQKDHHCGGGSFGGPKEMSGCPASYRDHDGPVL